MSDPTTESLARAAAETPIVGADVRVRATLLGWSEDGDAIVQVFDAVAPDHEARHVVHVRPADVRRPPPHTLVGARYVLTCDHEGCSEAVDGDVQATSCELGWLVFYVNQATWAADAFCPAHRGVDESPAAEGAT